MGVALDTSRSAAVSGIGSMISPSGWTLGHGPRHPAGPVARKSSTAWARRDDMQAVLSATDLAEERARDAADDDEEDG